MRNRITYEVRSSGYDMYVLERSIHSVREQFLWLQHIRTLALVRFEAGDTGYSDVLRLEMEAEEIANRMHTLEDGRSALRARMLRLTGLTSPDDIIFPDALPMLYRLPDDTVLFSRMTAANPRLKRLLAEAESWKHRSDAAKRMGYPRFTIGAVYTIIDPRTDMVVPDNGRDALLAQVGISIPLFGSRYSSLEKQNIQQEVATRQSYEDETNILRQRLEEALRDYREAQRRVELMQKLLSLAEQARETALQEYTTGKTPLEQLIGIERSIIRYVLDKEQAQADLGKHNDFIQYLISEEY
jgi:outer membrane protein, heavy metal efflux system